MPLKDKDKSNTDDSGGDHQVIGINRKKIGFNTTLQIVSALVIFILINYLSFSDYLRWDLSTTKKFSVSDETKSYINEQLDKKVIITMAFLKSSKVRKQLKLLLEELSLIHI